MDFQECGPQDNNDANDGALLQHLKSHGFTNKPRLELVEYSMSGKSVRTLEAIQSGQCIINLSLSCVILPSEIIRREPHIYDGLESLNTLVLFLHNERLKVDTGKPSDWVAFIRLLPQTMELPALTPPLQQTFLEHPAKRSFSAIIEKCLTYLDLLFNFFRRHLTEKGLTMPLDYELLKWAYSVVNTHICLLNSEDSTLKQEDRPTDEVALVPFPKYINNSAYANCRVESNATAGTFKVFILKPYKENHKICMTLPFPHKMKSNRSLYLGHNFIFVWSILQLWFPDDQNRFYICPSPNDLYQLGYDELKACFRQMANSSESALNELANQALQNLEYIKANKLFEEPCIITWTKELIAKPKYVVRFTQNREIIVINVDGTVATAVQLPYRLPVHLELLFTLFALPNLTSRALITAQDIATLYTQGTSRRPDVTSLEQRNGLQLLSSVISYFLQRDFHFENEPNPVAEMEKYKQRITACDDPLKALLKNELAMWMYTKMQLEEMINSLEADRWENDEVAAKRARYEDSHA